MKRLDWKIKGKSVYGFFPLFSRIVYRPGEAEMVLKFNEEMKPYLLGLTGNFTMASILELFKLNSFYSCRIYLLMKEYKRYGERFISVKDLKELLGLENKYPKFKDFEINILKKAQSDIRKTDMAFEYTKQKVGKSIGQIRLRNE